MQDFGPRFAQARTNGEQQRSAAPEELKARLMATWSRLRERFDQFGLKLQALHDQEKIVTIGSMELDLSRAWRVLTWPLAMTGTLMSGSRGSSRRLSRLERAQQKLTTVKVARFAALGLLFGSVAAIVGFFTLFAWFSRDLPKPGEVVRRTGFSTKIYDRNNKLLYDLYDQERRTPIKIEQVPEHLKQATIAIEDKDFYKHQGFDVLTPFRIVYNVIFRQRVVGGSTLTQQLVKKALLSDERTLTRKFKEFVLALQIERTFTKDQILEMYLNEVPYGGTAMGVGSASEVYFNKPVSELSLIQSAILAGLPQRPSAYSPYIGKSDENGEPLWKERTRGVLRRMKEDGYVTDLAYEQALTDMDSVTFDQAGVDIKAPHFVYFVKEKLAEMYGDEVIEAGGFKVTTSLDGDLQQAAQQIVADEVGKVEEKLHITNGAAMIMNPNNGEVLAMVGSRDFNNASIGGQFNVVVDGLRQPGSSIKPVTYLALMQRGYTPASMLMDVKTKFAANDNIKAYEPNNYDGKFRGPVSVRNSLGSSLNVPAVKALAIGGLDNFLELAYKMGFVTLEPTKETKSRLGLSVTLGGGEVHMIDTVTAYSAFANGGRRIEPVSILKVEDKDGRVLFEHKAVDGPEVLTAEEAFLINNILADDSAREMAFGRNSLLNIGPGVSVKTGTTNDLKDNWAIGWSKNAIVGAWVGNNDNTQMKAVASGVSGASPIWRQIMQAVIKAGYAAPTWEPPAGVEKVAVDAISGYPAHDELDKREEYVIKNSLPALPDPIHSKLKLCKGQNKLATDAQIAAGEYDEKIFVTAREDDPVSADGKNRWQEAIDTWIAGQSNDLFKPPTELCGDQGDVFVKLNKPENEKSYSETSIEVDISADSNQGIEKIEVWVNGSVREAVNDGHYNSKLNLPAGQYEIWAKAFSRSGKVAESGHVKIGTGGQGWQQPSPTPSPSPSPSPSPLITPLPSLVPSPSPH